jgi:hypothetical protein
VTKLADVTSVVLLLLAAGAFAAGVFALTNKEDLSALYWLIVGALSLRAATDMLRPKSSAR